MSDAHPYSRVENFGEPRPARTFVAVAELPYGARVAIEAVEPGRMDSSLLVPAWL